MAAVRAHRVLPGFGLSLGFTLAYMSLVVLAPLSAVFIVTATMSLDAFLSAVASPRVVASYRLTFGASLLAALINVVPPSPCRSISCSALLPPGRSPSSISAASRC
jgi:sulfate transport system permease protein